MSQPVLFHRNGLERDLREHMTVCRNGLSDDQDDKNLDACRHNIVLIAKTSLMNLVQARQDLQTLRWAQEDEDKSAAKASKIPEQQQADSNAAPPPTTPALQLSANPAGLTSDQVTQVLEHIGFCLSKPEDGGIKFTSLDHCKHNFIIVAREVVEESMCQKVLLQDKVTSLGGNIKWLEQRAAAQSQNIALLKETNGMLQENIKMLSSLKLSASLKDANVDLGAAGTHAEATAEQMKSGLIVKPPAE